MFVAKNGADRSFRTDELRADLTGHSIRAAAHVMLGRLGRFLITIGSTIVLARLITPADFGVVAMVSAFTAFAYILRDSGLSMATIQRAELTHAQASTLFWASIGISLSVALATAAFAPVVAWFFKEPRLTLVMAAIATSIFLGGIGLQHSALLRRGMQLAPINVALVLSAFTAAAIAIAAAIVGAGYWSLVIRDVVAAGVNSALLWMWSGWRPGLPVRRSGVRPLLKFGGALTGAQILGVVIRKVDDILVGWAWGPASVGLYSRAYNLLLMPSVQLNVPISTLVVPALSALQREPERFRRYYRNALELVSFCGYPLVIVMFVAADETILVFLGEQWRGAIDIFRALGPATMAEVTLSAGGWVNIPFGRADRELKWGLIASPLFVCAVMAGLPWGVLGVATAVSIVRCALLIPALTYKYRDTPVRLGDFFAGVWPPLVAAVAAGGLLFFIEMAWLGDLSNPITRLVLMVAIYGVLYLLFSVMIPGGRTRVARIMSSLRYFKQSRSAPPQRALID